MGKAKKILIVDDDKELVESVREIIEAGGYEVHAAHDGASGLAAAKKIKPDLIILDVMMATDTEGFEISREIPKIPEIQKVPVIMLTGIREKMKLPYKFDPDDAWLPVKSVLEKPVEPERLMEEIKKYAK